MKKKNLNKCKLKPQLGKTNQQIPELEKMAQWLRTFSFRDPSLVLSTQLGSSQPPVTTIPGDPMPSLTLLLPSHTLQILMYTYSFKKNEKKKSVNYYSHYRNTAKLLKDKNGSRAWWHPSLIPKGLKTLRSCLKTEKKTKKQIYLPYEPSIF